jgi:hypothetical protein
MDAKALLLLPLLAANAAAQPTVRQPDQFYTNGKQVNAWSVDSREALRSTMWLAKNPLDSPGYRQMTVLIYDSQPNRAYYLDQATQLVVGRLDLSTEQFSLLPRAARKPRVEDIDESTFPPPGELPNVADMFAPLPAGRRVNRKRMQLPPPTVEFPQLENSVWETSYMAANRMRVRAEVRFTGDRGTYQLTDKPGLGHLSDVQYETENDAPLIRGKWSLGNANGYFRFNIPADNLNVFWGEFGFELGKTVGAWDGVRQPEAALKEIKKPLR